MFPALARRRSRTFSLAVDGTMMSVQLRESNNGEALNGSAPVALFRERIIRRRRPAAGCDVPVFRDARRHALPGQCNH